MNKNIEESVKELILETLPSAQGRALKDELERLYQVEKDLAEAMLELEKLRGLCSGYQADLDKHQALSKRELEVGEREEADRLRGQAAAAREALIDLREAHASERVEDHKNMVELVFKSPSYRKSVSSTKDVFNPVDGGGNGVSGFITQNTVNELETTTIKED